MGIVSVLLAPFALLFSGTAGAEPASDSQEPPAGVKPTGETASRAIPGDPVRNAGLAFPAARQSVSIGPADGGTWRSIAESFRAQSQDQVRIEQRVTIRISPRRPPVEPQMLMDMPDRETAPRLTERKMGKCLPISGIAGVQVSGGNRLILFMRDRTMVSAALERACRARDFYSGFYIERHSDGQLCVDRDTLLSRSGSNCKVSRIRRLVEDDD